MTVNGAKFLCVFGGGAASWSETAPTGGADGIVVIRYNYNENPQGMALILR